MYTYVYTHICIYLHVAWKKGPVWQERKSEASSSFSARARMVCSIVADSGLRLILETSEAEATVWQLCNFVWPELPLTSAHKHPANAGVIMPLADCGFFSRFHLLACGPCMVRYHVKLCTERQIDFQYIQTTSSLFASLPMFCTATSTREWCCETRTSILDELCVFFAGQNVPQGRSACGLKVKIFVGVL